MANELSKERTSKVVLQIQKIRNISAPKSNEDSQAAPRLLKLSLTDGESFVQALELSPLNFLSRNSTPPGTKLIINNAKITLGYLLLTSDNCSLLGGRVPALIEKWELTKNITNNQRRNCKYLIHLLLVLNILLVLNTFFNLIVYSSHIEVSLKKNVSYQKIAKLSGGLLSFNITIVLPNFHI